MSDDEQIGFDIEFDDKTQAFLDWVKPEAMESGVRKLLGETLSGIADYDADIWWTPPVSTRVMEASKELFRDYDGFLTPENRDASDQFVRFYGECFVRRAGTEWTNRPEWDNPLYPDFTPSVQDTTGEVVLGIVAVADLLLRENYGPDMAEYEIDTTARDIRRMSSN
ncbi:hypothetical protein [Nocardia thraciensis]